MAFQLLVRDTEAHDPNPTTIGRLKYTKIRLGDLSYLHDGLSSIRDYTCISYVCSNGRDSEDPRMSDRTLPVLETAVGLPETKKYKPSHAYWIDYFCIPPKHPEKRLTLESMGLIYTRAKHVIVVLSKDMLVPLETIARSQLLEYDYLLVLENDGWVRSVWTFQEVINSQNLYIACEGSSMMVPAIDFLNVVGESLVRYRKKHGFHALKIRENLPNLDAFEDLIAAYYYSMWANISAYEVMSNMERRNLASVENYFYSMIGVITRQPSSRRDEATIPSLSQGFVEECVKKNDWSFIYTSVARADKSAEPWRPAPVGPLPTIFPWHSYGSQEGHYDEDGFWLDGMHHLQEAPDLSDATKDFLHGFLNPFWSQKPDTIMTVDMLTSRVRHFLALRGFVGVLHPFIAAEGLFFPLHCFCEEKEGSRIVVSATLGFVFGAPGLVLVETAGKKKFIPGVFVGKVPQAVQAVPVLLGQGNAREAELAVRVEHGVDHV